MTVLWIILGIIGGLIGLCVSYVLFLLIVTCFVRKKEYDKVSKFYKFLLDFTMGIALRLLNVKIEVVGADKLESIQGRFLLVSNHVSNFDPILTYYAFRKKGLAFVSKPENFKIPIASGLIRKCCFMAIDRVNPRNAIKTLLKASDLIKRDEVSVGIYPEGTRSKDGNLLEFHDGVFKIAQHAKVPVVIMVVKDTQKIAKRKFPKRITATVEIVDIIDKEIVLEKTTHELSAITKESMIDSLGK